MGHDPIWSRTIWIWGPEANWLYLSEFKAFVTLTRKLKVELL